MALLPLVQKSNQPLILFPFSSPNTFNLNQSKNRSQMCLHSHHFSRRTSLHLGATSTSFILLSEKTASAFDFRMTVPDQTLEEAENGIQSHAKNLLQVKELLEAETWKEAQKALRKSSALLKQDIYTIIQAKPGKQRPALRRLYSILFNTVSRLDFAARDKDVPRVWEYYDDIVLALDDILSRL